MTAPMLRSRQYGRPCRIHGWWCEVGQERSRINRTQDKRAWRRDWGVK